MRREPLRCLEKDVRSILGCRKNTRQDIGDSQINEERDYIQTHNFKNKKIKLKHLKFLEFKIFWNFKLLHPNIL